MLDSIFTDIVLLGIVMVLAHVFHNRFNSLISDAALVAAGMLLALYFIETPAQAFVFVLGTITGYTIEFFGVYTRAWRYNSKNGYSNWTGTGWGLLTLVIYKSMSLSWPILLVLLALALVIVFRKVKNNNIRDRFDVLDFTVRGLTFFIAPELFVLAFSLGIFVEYIGTEVFPTWKYPTIRYLNIGTGYSLLVIFTILLSEYVFGLRELTAFPLIVIGLFVLVYVFDVVRSAPAGSWMRRWTPAFTSPSPLHLSEGEAEA